MPRGDGALQSWSFRELKEESHSTYEISHETRTAHSRPTVSRFFRSRGDTLDFSFFVVVFISDCTLLRNSNDRIHTAREYLVGPSSVEPSFRELCLKLFTRRQAATHNRFLRTFMYAHETSDTSPLLIMQ